MQDTLVSSIRHWENQSWIKLWRWPMVANVAAMRNWPTHQNTSAISALGMNTTTTLGQTIGNPSSFSFQQTGYWYLPYPLRFSMMVMNLRRKTITFGPEERGKGAMVFSASNYYGKLIVFEISFRWLQLKESRGTDCIGFGRFFFSKIMWLCLKRNEK